MRYLLTEIQLCKIIENRASEILDDFFWNKIRGMKGTVLDFGYIHYTKGGRILFVIEKVPEDKELGMSKTLFNQIRDIFSLSEPETKEYFKKRLVK